MNLYPTYPAVMKALGGSALGVAFCLSAIAIAAEPTKPTNSISTLIADVSNETTAAIAPIESRFADATTDETPDFQKHVMPLLGRLGCNGRSCHGSFQGRGDFQLSLFGYDFSADHDALMAENTGRVDVDDVDESLILAKPIDADMHEGGKRFEKEEWQYRVLRNWIASGGTYDKKDFQTLKRLQIEPSEIQFRSDDENVSLQAIAHWADGTIEDVTSLCRFSSNDDSIAAIDENGHVRSGDSGDTHVVVYYDNAVVPVPVIRQVGLKTSGGPGESIAVRESVRPVDQLVRQKLNKLGVTPSGLCNDSEFIRRASLDITGMLPSVDRVVAFLDDRSADKRDRLVDELLESSAYSAWWATRMSDWTGNNAEQLNNVLPVRNVSTKLWFGWLRKRLEDNVPYDQIIEGIVTAQSRQPGESYEDYCREMTEICNGDLDRYADRESMPLFWSRRNFQKPEERAIGFAYTFLGVRIECAQCHKHPFDQWSKQDFDDFAKLFTPIRSGNANQVSPESKKEFSALMEDLTGGKKLRGGELRRAISKAASSGKVVPFGELYVNTRSIDAQVKRQKAQAKRQGKKFKPASIQGGKILGIDQEVALDDDPRPALMEWLRDPENPYFAKAIVNRVWSNYFGIGIVDPTDDLNLANPPSNAALLDYLATEFIENGFDLKWLHREIVLSDTYQRSAMTNATNQSDRVNFSRHIPRRLPAEVVYDMVMLATGSSDKANQMRQSLDKMAIADGKARGRNNSEFALEVFGQSIRETNCDCDRSDAPSLLQSIYLRNDAEMYRRIADRDGWVAEACQTLGIAAPRYGADPRERARRNSAEAVRKQIVSRLKQLEDVPESRREKMIARYRPMYKKMTARIGKEFEVPGFDDLVADPKSWPELTPAGLSILNEGDAKAEQSIEGVIRQAYLRTLSRHPEPEETLIAMSYIEESENATQGIEGLMWALVNTKEFITSH